MTTDPKAKLAAEEWESNQSDEWYDNTYGDVKLHQAFLSGVEYRDQHPSRDMVERIVSLARHGCILQGKFNINNILYPAQYWWKSIDEIMAELLRKKEK